MDCKGRTSACSCPQCDQEPTPQIAAGHVGSRFSATNFHTVSNVSMTEVSNSHPKGSIRSRRYGSSALKGGQNESVTDPTSLAWGDGGHHCRSFPCPVCHRRACNYNSSLKIGARTTSNSIDHVQAPFVSQLKDTEHRCASIPCRVCGRTWRWSSGHCNLVTRSSLQIWLKLVTIWFPASDRINVPEKIDVLIT